MSPNAPDVAAFYSRTTPAQLHGHVAGLHGFDIRGTGPVSHRALPVPIVPVIIGIDHDHVLRYSSGSVRLGSFVAGMAGETVLVEAERFTGVQVNLTPLGAWRVFGPQAADLAGNVISVDEALGRSEGSLAEQLASMKTWDERLGHVAGVLAARIDVGPVVSPEVDRAWRLLHESEGRRPVAEIASEVGWSPRHLSSRFRTYVGMTPKRTGRLLRFHAAAGLLGGETPLAEIAYICGYSDQSHFTNEVTDHAGLSPAMLRTQLRAQSPSGVSGVHDVE